VDNAPTIAFDEVGRPVATTAFDFDALDGTDDSDGYRAGRLDGIRGVLHLLGECRTPRAHHVRSLALRHVLTSGSETVSIIAARTGVSRRRVQREIAAMRKFAGLL
jgi:hypothetical protein